MSAIILGKLTLDEVIHGDLFDITFDIEDINLSGKTLLMQVRLEQDLPVIVEFKESDGSLLKTVTSNILTTVRLLKSSVAMKQVQLGFYKHSIIMYTSADDEQTIIDGLFTVVEKIAEKP